MDNNKDNIYLKEMLQSFLRNEDKQIVLSSQKQKQLVIKAQDGDKEARDLLLQSNMRFIISTAKTFINRGVDFSELFSEGYIGLNEAINRFNPQAKNTFISYAAWWVRHYIFKIIYTHGNFVRLPLNRIRELQLIKEVNTQIEKTNDNLSSAERVQKVSEVLNIPQKDVRMLLKSDQAILSLDDPAPAPNSSNVHQEVTILQKTSKEEISVEENVENIWKRDTIKAFLHHLTPRESFIITKYYGLGPEGYFSIEKISTMLKLKPENIRQIEKRAINKLKTAIRKKNLL